MRWEGHVARTGKRRRAYRFLVGKREGKRPFGKPRCRWRIILKRDHMKTVGRACAGFIRLGIGTSDVVNMVMKLQVT
jgi:hypothetical protein